MKLFHLVAPLAAIALISCSTQTKTENTETTTDETEQTEAPATAAKAADAVIELASDSLLRPDSKVDQLTFIDFNATWCGPCKLIGPSFHAVSNDYAGRVKFYSADIDRLPETAKAFNVTAVPTFVLLKPDGTSERFVGTDAFVTDADLNRASNIEEVTAIITPRMREVLDKNLK